MRVTAIDTFSNDRICLVQATAEDGTTGWGQAAPFNADLTAECVHRHIIRHVLGFEVGDTEGLADRVLYREYKFLGSYLWRALSGVDTALWDLRGRLEGKSVCELLGGKLKPVRVYASSMRRDITAAEEAERLRAACEKHGFTTVKVKIAERTGHDGDAWLGRTEEVLRAVRAALPDVTLFADANGGYSAEGAMGLRNLFDECGVAMLEEPCPYWEIEETAKVAAHLPIAVSGGEQDGDLAQWRRMFKIQSINMAQPDIGYVGGVTRLMRVAKMAEDAGIPVIPHCANHSLLAIFSLHVMAALPNPGPCLEYAIESNWAEGLYAPMPVVADGRVTPPEGPGWGVTVEPAWLGEAQRIHSELDTETPAE